MPLKCLSVCIPQLYIQFCSLRKSIICSLRKCIIWWWPLVLLILQIKPLAVRPVKLSEDEALQELGRPDRSNSKEQLSEVSPLPLFHRPPTENHFNRLERLRWDLEGGQMTAALGLRSKCSLCIVAPAAPCSHLIKLLRRRLVDGNHIEKKWLGWSYDIMLLALHSLKHDADKCSRAPTQFSQVWGDLSNL